MSSTYYYHKLHNGFWFLIFGDCLEQLAVVWRHSAQSNKYRNATECQLSHWVRDALGDFQNRIIVDVHNQVVLTGSLYTMHTFCNDFKYIVLKRAWRNAPLASAKKSNGERKINVTGTSSGKRPPADSSPPSSSITESINLAMVIIIEMLLDYDNGSITFVIILSIAFELHRHASWKTLARAAHPFSRVHDL